MKTPIIRLNKVQKIYKMGNVNVPALRGISLKVNKGDFLAITGPSGSGKSTALNMIGALDTPTSGNIYLDDQDIAHMHESDLAQLRGQKIGFIFQQFNLIPNLTALENVMIPMLFQNTDITKRRKRAEQLLNTMDLGERMHHKPSELSGGQQQRVAIARALANDPEVILADEPTGNLDTTTGKTVMQFLKKLHKDGKTIIVVTHDTNIAKNAQRRIMLKDGKIGRDKI